MHTTAHGAGLPATAIATILAVSMAGPAMAIAATDDASRVSTCPDLSSAGDPGLSVAEPAECGDEVADLPPQAQTGDPDGDEAETAEAMMHEGATHPLETISLDEKPLLPVEEGLPSDCAGEVCGEVHDEETNPQLQESEEEGFEPTAVLGEAQALTIEDDLFGALGAGDACSEFVPAPEPMRGPEIEPTCVPEPACVPKPTPDPAPEPTPDAEPTSTPELAPDAETTPAPEADAEPMPDPELAPDAEPMPVPEAGEDPTPASTVFAADPAGAECGESSVSTPAAPVAQACAEGPAAVPPAVPPAKAALLDVEAEIPTSLEAAPAAKKTGWATENGVRVYYIDGVRASGQVEIGGVAHYFRPSDGAEARAKFVYVPQSRQVYYYDASGRKVYGDRTLHGFRYRFDQKTGDRADSEFVADPSAGETRYYDGLGHMVYGDQTIDGSNYHFHPNGSMASDEFVRSASDGKARYYDTWGRMCYGERLVGGQWYYLDPSTGARVENGVVALPDGWSYYYYDATGARQGGLRSMSSYNSMLRVINACHATPSPGGGLCAAWITYVADNAGIGYFGGNANDMFYAWCYSSNRATLLPGMIVAVPRHAGTPAGMIYGHVCFYVGNGYVMDNTKEGYIRTMALDDWLVKYGTLETPRWGWLGGVALQ